MSITLEQLAELIGVDIELRRYAGQDGRWMARLVHTEVREGSCLASTYGTGTSPQSAMVSYCLQIAGKRIVVNAYTDRCQEFNVPRDLA